MPQMVFDGQFIQALYDDRGGDTLLVTFNEMESFANGRNYWGETVARNLNVSCIGVMTKTKNWFPLIEMDSIAANLKNIVKSYRYVINYGFSQGAYAALKYSMKISATHVLAFSPQWTIDPKLCGKFDLRFSAHFDERLHTGMEISRPDIWGTVCIFVDPYEKEDLYMQRSLKAR
jgi:hypothetical protein